MKKISILIPTYNEEANVLPLSEAIIAELEKLEKYDYEIIFIDNDSQDQTRPILRSMCSSNKKIKAIFNAKNFGQFNSPYYGLLQTSGDCVITMVADFQDPVDMIPKFVSEWEAGSKIVLGQKTQSKENKMVYALRSFFYNFMDKHSDHGYLKQVTGFGLYDKSFIDVLRTIDDPRPIVRGIVAEMGYSVKLLPYEQPKRRAGKSSNSFSKYYDAGVQNITNYTKFGVRLIMIVGLLFSLCSVVALIATLICKLINWNTYDGTMVLFSLVMVAVSFLMVFLGIIGEYVLNINDYVRKRPLVIEAERINFD